jgi:hypothetical protein
MPPMHKNTKRNSKNCFGAIWSIGDLVANFKVIFFEVRFQNRDDYVDKI